MSALILAFVLAAQRTDAPIRSTLSNDRPQFPIGLVKEMKLLEDVNLAAIKDPLRVGEFMEHSAKQGALLACPFRDEGEAARHAQIEGTDVQGDRPGRSHRRGCEGLARLGVQEPWMSFFAARTTTHDSSPSVRSSASTITGDGSR